MKIICGVDFSESADAAFDVACDLAARMGASLLIIQSVADFSLRSGYELPREFLNDVNSALAERTERARLRGISTETLSVADGLDLAVETASAEHNADLVIIGSGTHKESGIERHPEKLARFARVPTLVVRDRKPFAQWLDEGRALKVIVGLDFNHVSDSAWTWVQKLREVGPVQAVGVHLYWPPNEFARLGLGGVRSYVDPDPEVNRVVQRDLRQRFPVSDSESQRFVALPSIGRAADHLLAFARSENADLVVAGTHQKSAVQRLWESSVSRILLHDAKVSVAVVPASVTETTRDANSVRWVLVATDFSEAGNAAVQQAFAHVARGGKVYLAHVVDRTKTSDLIKPRDILENQGHLRERGLLHELIPRWASEEGKLCEVMIIESNDAATAIVQTAERLAVDTICIGIRGSGLSAAVLGSVSRKVVEKTRRAVLLVRT